jgi:NTE family protein
MNPDTDQNRPRKIGLALSGGGIRGVAHLGVIQALVEQGISFSHISGTSAGAVAAVFFSYGYTPKETLGFIKNTPLFKLLRPSFASSGLLSILNVESVFKKYIPHNKFSDLAIPITVTAVDLGKGKLVYFNDGELNKCILASCCLPGIFRPIVINGQMYVDGGVLNNFPVEPLVGHCDFIIGSTCNHLPEVTHIDSFGQLVDRAVMLSVNSTLNNHKILCDVVIEPHGLGSYGIFDTSHAEQIFDIGYQEGLTAIRTNEKLKEVIEGLK